MSIERFSASVAAKHIACHASANLHVAIPGYVDPVLEDTAASSKGTDMHSILEQAGEYTPKEMLAIAEAMMYVAKLRMTRRFKCLLEAAGEGWWLAQTPKPKTKADVVLYVADEIHVIDYKMGKIPVDVLDNSQLKYYALAFAQLAPKALGVWVHVVQPLADNIEKVWLSKAELQKFMDDSRAAETAIQGGSVTFTPGSHCQFCPANPHGRGTKGKPFCPTMLNLLYPSDIDVADILRS